MIREKIVIDNDGGFTCQESSRITSNLFIDNKFMDFCCIRFI